MKFVISKFRQRCEAAGLELVERGNGHLQIRGPVTIVNWYPESKRRTAYANGAKEGLPDASEEQVIQIATGTYMGDVSITRTKRASSTILKRKRQYLMKKNPHCYLCKKLIEPGDETIDHVIPLARGGSNRLDNLRLAHKECNQVKGHQLPGAVKGVFDARP